MSLVDALLKDFLRKKFKLSTEMPELEEKIPPHLRINLDTRYNFTIWNLAVTQAAFIRKFAKILGWEKVQEILDTSFLEWMDEFIHSDDMKPALDMMKKFAGKGQDPDASTFAQIVALYDYIIGNFDYIPESSSKKMIGQNLYCKTYECLKMGDLDEHLSCAGVCFGGMQLLCDMLNPKLKITGPRDGKEIGVPNVRFTKNRNVGDDICECEVVLED